MGKLKKKWERAGHVVIEEFFCLILNVHLSFSTDMKCIKQFIYLLLSDLHGTL